MAPSRHPGSLTNPITLIDGHFEGSSMKKKQHIVGMGIYQRRPTYVHILHDRFHSYSTCRVEDEGGIGTWHTRVSNAATRLTKVCPRLEQLITPFGAGCVSYSQKFGVDLQGRKCLAWHSRGRGQARNSEGRWTSYYTYRSVSSRHENESDHRES